MGQGSENKEQKKRGNNGMLEKYVPGCMFRVAR